MLHLRVSEPETKAYRAWSSGSDSVGGIMRFRVLVAIAAVCLVAGCSSPGKKPAAAPSTSAVAQAATVTPTPAVSSSAPDVTVGVICSNLDAQTKDLADLVGKLSSGQSVAAFGIGIPIVGASDAVKRVRLEHPGTQVDADLVAFGSALDDLDAAVTADKVDTDGLGWTVSAVRQAWKSLSLDCGRLGGYAFSNRL